MTMMWIHTVAWTYNIMACQTYLGAHFIHMMRIVSILLSRRFSYTALQAVWLICLLLICFINQHQMILGMFTMMSSTLSIHWHFQELWEIRQMDSLCPLLEGWTWWIQGYENINRTKMKMKNLKKILFCHLPTSVDSLIVNITYQHISCLICTETTHAMG